MPPVERGQVTSVDTEDRAEVGLTVETPGGIRFTETFDLSFNIRRALNFTHYYGVDVPHSEGVAVNVYTGDDRNPAHVLLSDLPLKRLGGEVLIPANYDLPVTPDPKR